MSVVKFLCPNGHQLSAPLNLVGKGGKCPKCNSQFVVPAPDPGEAGRSAAENGGSGPDLHVNLASGIREGSGTGSRPNQDIFVFLCPNGHRLNGPSSLRGKLGQCPHCGAKFRIPDDDPQDDELEPEGGPGAELVDAPPYDADAVEELPDDYIPDEPEPPFEEGVHPLAHIMNRLWYHKGATGEVEILLNEGEIMSPEHYSPVLSSSDYGVFATREGAGYSFSVIPWSNVRRLNVHKVEHLPLGAFTE